MELPKEAAQVDGEGLAREIDAQIVRSIGQDIDQQTAFGVAIATDGQLEQPGGRPFGHPGIERHRNAPFVREPAFGDLSR